MTPPEPSTEAGRALLKSLGSDWLHWADQAGHDAAATTILAIEAELTQVAVPDVAELREALMDVYQLLPPERHDLVRPSTKALLEW